MKRRVVGISIVLAALTSFGIYATSVWAAVLGGTIKSVTPKNGTVIVEQRAGGTKSFLIPSTAEIQVDGKKATIDKLQPGQSVTVTTSKSGDVLKIAAKGEGATPAATPTKPTVPKTETAKPEPAKPAGRRPAGKPSDEEQGWTQYRGPNRENRSADTGLMKEWPEDGPPLAWTLEGLGEGFSSVSVADDVIYTMGTARNEEAVFALKADGSGVLWSAPTGGGVFQDGNGNGPRGTPTIDGDTLYALGAQGDLVCLNRSNGKVKWSKNVLKEFQGNVPVWGICESVLIDGPQLICTPGGRKGAMVSLNKSNGATNWTCTVPNNPQAAYASAIIVETAGVRQYVNFTQNSIIGVQANNGRLLWGDDHSANGTANCSSPVAWEDHVFAASGYGKGGAAVKLAKAGTTVNANFLYHTGDMKNHHGGMVVLDGNIYGFDEAILTCLDIKTGKVAWKNRSVGKGAVTFADGHLYCRSEGGPIALVEATPDSYKEKSRFDQPRRSGRPAWAHPVVTGGKLYIRDQDKLLTFDVKGN